MNGGRIVNKARRGWASGFLFLLLVTSSGFLPEQQIAAQTAQWIWTSAHRSGEIPSGPVHYRKNFTLARPQRVEMVIAADDEFQVYYNGELVGFGAGYEKLTRIDLTPHRVEGDNLVAIRVSNTDGETAALASMIRIRLEGETVWRWLATDETWKSSVRVTPNWTHPRYDDSRWLRITELGDFGKTMPWDKSRLAKGPQPAPDFQTAPPTTESVSPGPNAPLQASEIAAGPESPDAINDNRLAPADPGHASTEKSEPATSSALGPASMATNAREAGGRKFILPDNVDVQQVLDATIGSIVAMEFNEFGQLILSREGGKLLLADFSKSTEGEVTIRQYCDSIDAVQGILPLNGDVYVTGLGPDGLGLYRLSDTNRDGNLEPVQTLARFSGAPGEHGPHGIALGADGMLYVIIGNASGLADEFSESSIVKTVHEGEIIPRMEDPGGHAAGYKAPGGTIVRVSLDGSKRELVAVGLRNAYDLAFNAQGELYFHESDMESDVGTPWYQPTRIYRASEGADFGWRSGTAVFPEYFIDCLPSLATSGRGSPTGAVFYDHVMLPLRYHGALFLGDWTNGSILCARPAASGEPGGMVVETFLSGEPLSVTDLAVGPDGALYFCTGGRGTEGGVYRVNWTGTVPEEFRKFDDTLARIIRQPQPQTAWARQELAGIKASLDANQWRDSLIGVIAENRNDVLYRTRALEIMLLYGPQPATELISQLASDEQPQMRRAAARAMGMRDEAAEKEVLLSMLDDADSAVREQVCASLRRRQITPPAESIVAMLGSESRSEVFAARRMLESMDVNSWREAALSDTDNNVFLNGCVSLMVVEPRLETAYKVLAAISQRMDSFKTEQDQLDMLRVSQLTLIQGKVDPGKIPLFTKRLVERFPAESGKLNRELSRTLACLKSQEVGGLLTDYLVGSPDSDLDKLQVLVNLQSVSGLMESEHRFEAIDYLERYQALNGLDAGNRNLYLATTVERFTEDMAPEANERILDNGHKWPVATLAAFYRLPEGLDDKSSASVIRIDKQLRDRIDPAAAKTRLACVAVLGRSADEKSMGYLREVWREEPSRRNDVALALAQQPSGPNWPYLVEAMAQVSDDTAMEIIDKLAGVNERPVSPAAIRDLIETGYRLRQSGAAATDRLLQHWTASKVEASAEDWRTNLQQWKDWFEKQWPGETPVSFRDAVSLGDWSVDELLEYAAATEIQADNMNGMAVYAKAQCAKCHRFNGIGESLGPDLTTIARRFSRRETLHAILSPSDHIPDQYAGKKILLADGRQLIGLVSKENEKLVVLQQDGKRVVVEESEVEEMAPATTSVMPDDLLKGLSKDEIRDLILWLHGKPEHTASSAGDISRAAGPAR
jgi:putative heme-binding domain-containing protein